ncbi:MAG: lysylphosphatidylglycerol synthase transmembrane domain-containing protein [Ardenticatenaceae bacterium]
MPKHIGSLLRIGVTLFGLALAATQINPTEMVAILANTHWFWVLATFMLVNLSLVVRAYRWFLLLRGVNRSVSFGRLVELYFVGNFFNAFLPSGFGGDVVRVVEVAQEVPANVATGTVLVDRLSGLFMLFVMALLAIPFRPESFPTTLTWLISLTCIAGLVGLAVFFDGRLIQRFGKWLPHKLSPVGDGPIAQVMLAVQQCGRQAIWGALAVSTLFNLMLVAWWTTASYALTYQVDYSYNLLVVPILSIALLIPSVGGLGVRETLAPMLFVSAGLTAESAVALSLLVFIILRLSSLVGAPIYLWSALRGRKQKIGD